MVDKKERDKEKKYQKELWNNKAKKYAEINAKNNLDIFITLCNLAKVYDTPDPVILEVGCGPGEGTKFLAYFISNPLIIYACDLSPNMITCANNLIEKDDLFKETKDNKDHKETYFKSWKAKKNTNVEQDTKEQKSKKKVIKVFEGDSEALPFENEQFNIYISSLCLMITDYRISLQEAYRVLKKGGRMAISIWGKKNETTCRIIEDIAEKHGLNVPSLKYYQMGENEESLKKMCYDIGFSDVRIGYINNYKRLTEESIKEKMDSNIKEQIAKLEKEKKEKDRAEAIKKEIDEVVHQKLTVEKMLPKFNILCLIAIK